ncbi:hypothetical protein HG535_0G02050 [Zygotorulaspora mrakii]|uniref:Uncharacterized protein n=1 Tax=Zygotorulaspora mrakii TaxID=42260 RepID=A0A7H9B6L1_ZYGMR|nr:uncharacterized protein HG535_0G02050 [Zygotorulaspora mrakii]QLG74321.1 hypothetical protein HG535_0G02050 [Zygotorulaspora mrakii]
MESIDLVCGNLVKAFTDQGDDPVSLVTIIEMYIEQVDSEGTIKEKAKFLECLLSQLQANPKIVGEIGWDLPKGLLSFLSAKNVNYHRKLSTEVLVTLIMACFNEIALFGNPKECLLVGTQLLSELSVIDIAFNLEDDRDKHKECNDQNSDSENFNGENTNSSSQSTVDDLTPTQSSREAFTNEEIQQDLDTSNSDKNIERNPAEFFFGLQSYILFELIQTVLRRISTLYPSKFLGMAVSAIVKYMKVNIEELEDTNIVLRRVYTLCRVYVPSNAPGDIKKDGKLSSQELEKIQEDELALQRKLLCSLCTFGIGYALKTVPLRSDIQYYSSLTGASLDHPQFYQSTAEICLRYFQLALSFDIDVKESLLEFIKETRNIYRSLPPDSLIVNEEARSAISQVIYQLSYTYQLQKLAKCKDLILDSNGVFILSALHQEATGKTLFREIRIQDAVCLYLRCTTPQLFSEEYTNLAAETAARYWLWVAITNSSFKEMKDGLNELPSYLNTVFLQMYLMRNCNQVNEQMRMVNVTLLTRILCLMPEEISFSFAVDTLLTCPYAHAKLIILGILKDLMLKTCQCKEGVTSEMEKLNISAKGAEQKESNISLAPPPPPPRPYILLNEHRMASMHSLAMLVVQNAKKEDSEKDDLILLLTYINFFIALKSKWNSGLLTVIHSEIQDAFAAKDDETKEVKLIKLSNDTLGENL